MCCQHKYISPLYKHLFLGRQHTLISRADPAVKNDSTRIVEILSIVPAVIGLCLLLALTLQARLSAAERFALKLFSSSRRAFFVKLILEHALQNSLFMLSI